MCLALTEGASVIVPPSRRAEVLAIGVLACCFCNGLLAMLLSCTYWLDGLWDLLVAWLGYTAVKGQRDGFSIQHCACFTFMNATQCLLSSVRLVLWLRGQLRDPTEAAVKRALAADAGDKHTGSAHDDGGPVVGGPWLESLYAVGVSAGPPVYLLSTILGFMLYSELRRIARGALLNAYRGFAQRGARGGISAGVGAEEHGGVYGGLGQRNVAAEEARPAAAGGAFSGKGVKLSELETFDEAA